MHPDMHQPLTLLCARCTGDSEYHVYWLASEACARGWDVTVLADVHKGDVGSIKVISDFHVLSAVQYDLIVVHGADCSTQNAVHLRMRDGAVASPVLFLLIKPSESEAALAGISHARYLGWSTSIDFAHIHKLGQGAKAVQVTHGVQQTARGMAGKWRSRLGMGQARNGQGGRLFVSAGGFGPHKGMLELATAFGEARHEGDRLLLFGYQPPDEVQAPRVSHSWRQPPSVRRDARCPRRLFESVSSLLCLGPTRD